MGCRTTIRGALLQVASLVLCSTALAGEWREIRIPHVVLRTDLSAKDAREVAVERARERLIIAGWPSSTLIPDDVIVATVFADWAALPKTMDTQPEEDTGDVPVQFIESGGPDPWATPTERGSRLNHVLVHHLAAGIYRHPPPWFVEGLAQLMETIRIGNRAGEDPANVIMGEPNARSAGRYLRVRTVKVADALRWDGRRATIYAPTAWGLSGISWAMVFWLYNVHPDALQALLDPGRNPDQAWKELRAFLESPDIDETLYRWITHAQVKYSALRVGTLPEVPLTEMLISEAEVHATRARVLLHRSRAVDDGAELRAQAGRELAACVALEPRNLTATLLRQRMDPAAEQLLVQEDWREQNNLALERIEAGKAVEAVTPALHAAALAPFQPAVLDTLATVQARVGQCADAQATEARAIQLLSKGTDPKTRKRFQERLDAHSTECPATAAQTPGAPRPAGGAGRPASAPPGPNLTK